MCLQHGPDTKVAAASLPGRLGRRPRPEPERVPSVLWELPRRGGGGTSNLGLLHARPSFQELVGMFGSQPLMAPPTWRSRDRPECGLLAGGRRRDGAMTGGTVREGPEGCWSGQSAGKGRGREEEGPAWTLRCSRRDLCEPHPHPQALDTQAAQAYTCAHIHTYMNTDTSVLETHTCMHMCTDTHMASQVSPHTRPDRAHSGSQSHCSPLDALLQLRLQPHLLESPSPAQHPLPQPPEPLRPQLAPGAAGPWPAWPARGLVAFVPCSPAAPGQACSLDTKGLGST